MEIKCDKKKCPFWIGFEIRYKGEKDKKKVKKILDEIYESGKRILKYYGE
jgi:hypothetical protein